MDHQQKDETAVAYLATAMNTKLARARAKGRSGWDTPECTQQHLSNLLREHVEKGDPVDVANYCAFLAARGEGIAPRQCLAQIEEPAAPAAVAPRGEYPHEQMDAMALDRYKVVPSNASMLWSHAVVAGDGTQQLYVGREVECQNMARKFAGAFLDGAFAFHSMAAAPTAQAAPALEATAAPAGDEAAAFNKWFQGEQGKPYQGMWEFARAAWMAREAAPQAPAAPSEDTHVFTTPYPELNDLLRETSFLVSEGANMDGAVLWLESLERVLALLAAPAAPSALATQVIENLLQLARIVNTAVEDWGETKEDDSLEVIFHKEEADKMEAILEFFDGLPDAPEEEGVILSGPSRAARVLRAMEAPAAPAVDAWRPIETAPKDGTAVLVYPPIWGGRTCSTAKYNEDQYSKKPRPYWDRDDAMGKVTYCRDTPPTHWMPQPATPLAAQAAAKGGHGNG